MSQVCVLRAGRHGVSSGYLKGGAALRLSPLRLPAGHANALTGVRIGCRSEPIPSLQPEEGEELIRERIKTKGGGPSGLLVFVDVP